MVESRVARRSGGNAVKRGRSRFIRGRLSRRTKTMLFRGAAEVRESKASRLPQEDFVEPALLEAKARVEEIIQENFLANFRCLRIVSSPHTVKLHPILVDSLQQFDQCLSIELLAVALLLVLHAVFDLRPTTVLKHRIGEIAAAARSGTDVLDLRLA